MEASEVNDTTILIWEYYFKVRVPHFKSRSIDDVRTRGVNISGIKEVDQDIENTNITTFLTINNMIDLFKEGVSVSVIHYNDTKTIYEYISRHLEAWKIQLSHGINIGDAPIEDLIAMDMFANLVYDHAKYIFTEGLPDSVTARYMNNLMSINGLNLFNRKKEIEENIEYPERNSYSQFLSSIFINNTRN